MAVIISNKSLNLVLMLCLFLIISFAEGKQIGDTTARCQKVYGVEAGDTCNGIMAKFKLTAHFFAINPNINCNTIFVVGFGGVKATARCQKVYGVEAGDTCNGIMAKFKLTAHFFAINPNINCNTIFVGQWLCIAGTTK
ncbi:unnamed protein product [Malus baccata var. baccata]